MKYIITQKVISFKYNLKGEIMNNLQIFKGNKVELLEFDNNILFNPYDVGACLELEKSSIKYYLKNMNTN